MSRPHLFVWRGIERLDYYINPDAAPDCVERYRSKLSDLYHGYETRCPFCRGTYHIEEVDRESQRTRTYTCRRCGFNYLTFAGQGLQDYWTYTDAALLRKMDINDAEVGLEELCTHLGRRFSDVYSLSPTRFEEVVENVFQRNYGYATRRTQTSRDGGYDIILLERSSEDQIIVEVKRYAKERHVGVGVVRQLHGVQLEENFRKAILVTSSTFTNPAREAAAAKYPDLLGFELQLVDATQLLRDLQCYDERLPPLDEIDLAAFEGGHEAE